MITDICTPDINDPAFYTPLINDIAFNAQYYCDKVKKYISKNKSKNKPKRVMFKIVSCDTKDHFLYKNNFDFSKHVLPKVNFIRGYKSFIATMIHPRTKYLEWHFNFYNNRAKGDLINFNIYY